ncbi:UBX domain containing protein [Trichuris trichiura]|uniref:UBX domain-containing protein 4 n=1 Tax=Trichuris trichiura TaxID=36087 RepID=A0A077ZHY1_TRITR|nr:UBX domain containing protein [Trichuris trichiura]
MDVEEKAICFLGGGNESQEVIEQWDNACIRLLLKGKNYVALKLQQGSAAAMQFCSVYPVLSYPSTYFIRSDGGVQDVMKGPCKTEDLQEKIKKFVEKRPLSNVGSTHTSHLPHSEVLPNDKGGSSDVMESEHTGTQNDDIRSKAGALEAKQVLEEIRTKKAEDDRLREQLRKQIEADSTHARIQCRFPNGDRLEEVFDKTESLRTVYDIVRSYVEKPCDFKLICLFSRYEYCSNDLDKSLEELGLNPSAVLLVVTDHRKQSITGVNPVGQMFNFIYGWLLNPAWRLVRNVVGWFFPLVLGSSAASNDVHGKDVDVGRPRRGGLPRRGSDDDDDDSNAVWNGNSTQQL